MPMITPLRRWLAGVLASASDALDRPAPGPAIPCRRVITAGTVEPNEMDPAFAVTLLTQPTRWEVAVSGDRVALVFDGSLAISMDLWEVHAIGSALVEASIGQALVAAEAETWPGGAAG